MNSLWDLDVVYDIKATDDEAEICRLEKSGEDRREPNPIVKSCYSI